MAVGNLEFIKSASGTSVTTLDITDCFSDKYDVYYCTVTNIDLSSSGGYGVNIRLIDSLGSVISASEYSYPSLQLKSYMAFAEGKNATASFILTFSALTGGSAIGAGHSFYIINPNDSSSYTFGLQQGSQFYETAGLLGTKGIGVHKVAEQITGLNIFNDGGINFDNINIKVFGVK